MVQAGVFDKAAGRCVQLAGVFGSLSGPQEMQETKKGVHVNTPYDMKQLKREQAMEAFVRVVFCVVPFFPCPGFVSSGCWDALDQVSNLGQAGEHD